MPNTQRLLELALKGLEAERAKIDGEIAQIKTQINGRLTLATDAGAGAGSGMPAARLKKRRRMSAAARKRISEGMKRRYAAMRAAMKK